MRVATTCERWWGYDWMLMCVHRWRESLVPAYKRWRGYDWMLLLLSMTGPGTLWLALAEWRKNFVEWQETSKLLVGATISDRWVLRPATSEYHGAFKAFNVSNNIRMSPIGLRVTLLSSTIKYVSSTPWLAFDFVRS